MLKTIASVTYNIEDISQTYFSTVGDNEIHEVRANDIANILKFDKMAYKDLNIQTVLRACMLAGLIEPN